MGRSEGWGRRGGGMSSPRACACQEGWMRLECGMQRTATLTRMFFCMHANRSARPNEAGMGRLCRLGWDVCVGCEGRRTRMRMRAHRMRLRQGAMAASRRACGFALQAHMHQGTRAVQSHALAWGQWPMH